MYLAFERELLNKLRDTTLRIGCCVVEQSVIATLLDPGARQHKDLHAKQTELRTLLLHSHIKDGSIGDDYGPGARDIINKGTCLYPMLSEAVWLIKCTGGHHATCSSITHMQCGCPVVTAVVSHARQGA